MHEYALGHPLRFPTHTRGRPAPPAECCFLQVPGRCPRCAVSALLAATRLMESPALPWTQVGAGMEIEGRPECCGRLREVLGVGLLVLLETDRRMAPRSLSGGGKSQYCGPGPRREERSRGLEESGPEAGGHGCAELAPTPPAPATHTHTHSVMSAHNIGICGRTISAQCVNIYEGLRRGVWQGEVVSESLFFPSPNLSRM